MKGGDGAVDLDDVDESEDESLPPPEAAVVDGAGGGRGAEFRHASPCGPPQVVPAAYSRVGRDPDKVSFEHLHELIL